MALSSDRATARMQADLLVVPVAAAKKIYAGALVVLNASGYAQPGTTATTLTYLGRAEEAVDNTGGSNGAVSVRVRRHAAFRFENSGSDPVDQADMGKSCWIVDDATVAGTDGDTGGGATRSVAGVVVGIDADGVWVE